MLFSDNTIAHKITSVKKFYFLDYFYVLLKSVSLSQDKNIIFDKFRYYKDELGLAESKYKRLVLSKEKISHKQLVRYEYTFDEVIEEAEMYDLIKNTNGNYSLKESGLALIYSYENNIEEYKRTLLQLIESNLYGFHYLINRCYSSNKNGLLIFPIYSPLKLNIAKKTVVKTKDINNYLYKLKSKLEADILIHLKRSESLDDELMALKQRLYSGNILAEDPESKFEPSNYNKLTTRVRNYWINHFLTRIYDIQMSPSYFDIWCYRGKQLGIINATDFYYNFDGKIVYPTSVISKSVNNSDFVKGFYYPNDTALYIHNPTFESIQEDFTRKLYESYVDIKGRAKTYFINLADLRDVVCFKCRISYDQFEEFINHLYQLNLRNEIRIKISLEVDKLPTETNAMYLKREPIVVENKIRNIIAIEIKK